MEGRGGASGGDRAGGVVGVVVSRVFRIFEEFFRLVSDNLSLTFFVTK